MSHLTSSFVDRSRLFHTKHLLWYLSLCLCRLIKHTSKKRLLQSIANTPRASFNTIQYCMSTEDLRLRLLLAVLIGAVCRLALNERMERKTIAYWKLMLLLGVGCLVVHSHHHPLYSTSRRPSFIHHPSTGSRYFFASFAICRSRSNRQKLAISSKLLALPVEVASKIRHKEMVC